MSLELDWVTIFEYWNDSHDIGRSGNWKDYFPDEIEKWKKQVKEHEKEFIDQVMVMLGSDDEWPPCEIKQLILDITEKEVEIKYVATIKETP